MFFCMAGAVYSQNLPVVSDTSVVPYRLGIFAGLGPSLAYSTDLSIPGYSFDCGNLGHATGSEWNAGMVLDVPFLSRLTWHMRLGISRATGTMRHEGDPFPLRAEDGAIADGRVDQVLDYRATGIDLSFSGSTPLIAGIQGELGLGMWLRLHSEQTHSEVAVLPEELLLANNRREMEMSVGSLFPYRSVLPLAVMGLRYDLPIGHESYFSPEVRFTYPLMDRVSGGAWRSLQVSLGASVRFGFPGARDADPVQPVDTIPPPPPVLIADILTYPNTVTVEIAERDSTDWVPVLNGIYFDEGSAAIPDRYVLLDVAQTVDFSISNLTGTALNVYYNALNIIGLRMQRIPDATLQIVGYRNGREADPSLGLQRAEAIRDYLVETWDVFSKRISVKGEGLPSKPVSERTVEGVEENAVARIFSNSPDIASPINRKYVLRVATPPSVTFYPRAIAQAGLAQWRLEIVDGENANWKSFQGEGVLPDSIRWDWTSDSGMLPNLPIVLGYRFLLQDSAGQSAQTAMMPIDVRQKIIRPNEPDTLIESYSLLLFDYDSPEVSAADQGLLQAIAGRVKSGSTVRFTGYTDSLGDAARNRQLGLQRAQGAARIFSKFAPENVSVIINSEGGERERFPFDIPEGRAYNRTVVIEVRTPTIRTEGGE